MKRPKQLQVRFRYVLPLFLALGALLNLAITQPPTLRLGRVSGISLEAGFSANYGQTAPDLFFPALSTKIFDDVRRDAEMTGPESGVPAQPQASSTPMPSQTPLIGQPSASADGVVLPVVPTVVGAVPTLVGVLPTVVGVVPTVVGVVPTIVGVVPTVVGAVPTVVGVVPTIVNVVLIVPTVVNTLPVVPTVIGILPTLLPIPPLFP